ncbi:unnamed protein product [Urochloa decumbens]|uniref:FAS1 domain-containing protein n=1 Tax=Urochloa decumbens TaxID=240449 RepID=A0ABC8ZL73_9POAL
MAQRIAVAAAFLALALAPAALAQSPGPAAAPAGPPNVTATLEKGGQYTTFMRLMKETQQDTQLNSQLNSSFGNNGGGGYTVFAPTDNAFNNLKPGTLNSLTQQQQVSLVQGHILPLYYSMDSFQTASNPVRINNALYSAKPLAVYSVDKVLLPLELFGAKAPAAAPTASQGKPKKGGSSDAASGPAGSDDSAPTGAASGRAVGLSFAGLAAALAYLL